MVALPVVLMKPLPPDIHALEKRDVKKIKWKKNRIHLLPHRNIGLIRLLHHFYRIQLSGHICLCPPTRVSRGNEKPKHLLWS